MKLYAKEECCIGHLLKMARKTIQDYCNRSQVCCSRREFEFNFEYSRDKWGFIVTRQGLGGKLSRKLGQVLRVEEERSWTGYQSREGGILDKLVQQDFLLKVGFASQGQGLVENKAQKRLTLSCNIHAIKTQIFIVQPDKFLHMYTLRNHHLDQGIKHLNIPKVFLIPLSSAILSLKGQQSDLYYPVFIFLFLNFIYLDSYCIYFLSLTIKLF